ncbi:MAG TPA: hypothetical protein VGH28_08810 [Polyangiaceae bacterium]|jgi:hypothetical protein
MSIRVVCTLFLSACAHQAEPSRATIAPPPPVAKASATASAPPPPPTARAAQQDEPSAMDFPIGQSPVELATRALMAAVQPCVDAALKADPKLKAKAKLELDLRADGAVDHASWLSPDTLSPSTQACVVAGARGIALPPLDRRPLDLWVQVGR